MRSQFIVGAVVALFLVPLLPVAQATSYTVVATNFQWTSSTLEIQPGDSVTFTNGSGNAHSWVRDDGLDSCNLPCTRTFSSVATIPYHCGLHPSMQGTIQVGSVIQVAITAPTLNAIVSGLVPVTGTADHLREDIRNVSVRFDNGPSVEATITGSGQSITWDAALDSTGLVDGAHELVARATALDGSSKETRLAVTVDNPDIIDLRVTLVSAPTGSTSRTSTISFTMRNEGNVKTPDVLMRAEYFYQGEWLVAAERSVLGVNAQGSHTNTLTWSPAGVLLGRFDIRVIADPLEAIPDVDRANNVRGGSAGWVTSSVAGIDLLDPI